MLHQWYPPCLVCFTRIVFDMGVTDYTAVVSWDVATRICLSELVAFLCCSHLTFSSMRFASIHVVPPYSSIHTAWKKSRFILSVWSDLQMTDDLSTTVYTFARLISFSADEILLLGYMNLSTNFRCSPFEWR